MAGEKRSPWAMAMPSPSCRHSDLPSEVITSLCRARGDAMIRRASSPHVNEAADGQATVDWIARQPWFNGGLGTWGPSYLGYMQWAVAAAAPEALSAMVVMIASAENYTVSHPDGAFGLETRLRWSQGIQPETSAPPAPPRSNCHRFSGEEEAACKLPLTTCPCWRRIPSPPVSRSPSSAISWPTTSPTTPIGWPGTTVTPWPGLRHRCTSSAAGTTTICAGCCVTMPRSRPPAASLPDHRPLAPRPPRRMMAGLREGLTWFDAHLKSLSSSAAKDPSANAAQGQPARRAEHTDQRAAKSRYASMSWGLRNGASWTTFPRRPAVPATTSSQSQAGNRSAASRIAPRPLPATIPPTPPRRWAVRCWPCGVRVPRTIVPWRTGPMSCATPQRRWSSA